MARRKQELKLEMPEIPYLGKGYYRTTRCGYSVITRVVSVKLPIAIITEIDDLVSRGFFQNRSDAIREAIRLLIMRYREAEAKPGLTYGVR